MKKAFLIIMTIGLLSCSSKVSNEELVGKYCWSSLENGELEIFDDGTYRYHIKSDSSQIKENIGTWSLSSNNREIQFSEFSFISDGFGKGTWISRIKKRDNEVHLIYASEENIYLKKIE
jgi:hypothetical protein